MIAFLAWLHIPPFRRWHIERLTEEYLAMAELQASQFHVLRLAGHITAEQEAAFRRSFFEEVRR